MEKPSSGPKFGSVMMGLYIYNYLILLILRRQQKSIIQIPSEGK
jgi:hypothetical protein